MSALGIALTAVGLTAAAICLPKARDPNSTMDEHTLIAISWIAALTFPSGFIITLLSLLGAATLPVSGLVIVGVGGVETVVMWVAVRGQRDRHPLLYFVTLLVVGIATGILFSVFAPQ